MGGGHLKYRSEGGVRREVVLGSNGKPRLRLLGLKALAVALAMTPSPVLQRTSTANWVGVVGDT